MLTVVERVLFLQNVDLFDQVPAEQLSRLAAISEVSTYLEGDSIYEEGDEADAMYIVLDGSVRLHQAYEEITIASTRDAFGSWALFDDEPRIVTATVVEDCRLLRIERESFFDLLSDNVQITRSILKSMSARLRQLMDRVGLGSGLDKSR